MDKQIHWHKHARNNALTTAPVGDIEVLAHCIATTQ